MSETDWFENTQQLDRKCPLCGGTRTRFGESYSDGDEWVEHSVSRQQCKNCGLGCKHWDRIDALTAQNAKLREACEAAMQPVKIIKMMHDEGKLKSPDGWATPSQLDAALGKE